MLAFVMNLETRPERWEKTQKLFLNSGMKLKRFIGKKLENGYCGTLHSTIAILKEAIKMDLDNVLIIEDDCKLGKNWKKVWKLVKKWLDAHPKEWDIYSGGGTTILYPREVVRINDNISLYDPFFSLASHWIYISKHNYQKIIDSYTNALYWCTVVGKILPNPCITTDSCNNLLKTLVSYPFIATQYETKSDTANCTRKHKKPFEKSEKYLKELHENSS